MLFFEKLFQKHLNPCTKSQETTCDVWPKVYGICNYEKLKIIILSENMNNEEIKTSKLQPKIKKNKISYYSRLNFII